MKRKIQFAVILLILILGCQSETCKIDFESNSELFENTVKEIYKLGIPMESKETYYRVVMSFKKSDNKFEQKLFDEIELIECHEDGTIIFEAHNCNKESGIRDVINFIAYSPLGQSHVEGKRNTGEIIKLNGNWYSGKHINSIAN